MSLEDLHKDLEAIAKHVGPLDEDAVTRATTILARARYTASPNPAALLVDDLKRVIEAIPNYPVPETSTDVEWSSYKFRSYARRYFSLDAIGEGFTHRRTFGRKDPGGSVGAWMTRGILYRVAAGLIDIWASSDSERGLSYCIDFLHALRYFKPNGLARDILEYELTTFTSGAHIVVLPLPAKSTTLMEFDAEHAGSDPKPQVVGVDGTAASNSAVVFSVKQEGVHVRIKVQHTSPGSYPQTDCVVERQTKKLVLEVDLPVESANAYSWDVSRSSRCLPGVETLAEPSEGKWSCEDPEPGSYALVGTRLSQSERRRASHS